MCLTGYCVLIAGIRPLARLYCRSKEFKSFQVLSAPNYTPVGVPRNIRESYVSILNFFNESIPFAISVLSFAISSACFAMPLLFDSSL